MSVKARMLIGVLAAATIAAGRPPQGGRGGPGSEALREGTRLDVEGKSAEAKAVFQKAIDSAATPPAKANAQRAMAMSYAFDGDCRNTGKYEQMVIDYWATQEKD